MRKDVTIQLILLALALFVMVAGIFLSRPMREVQDEQLRDLLDLQVDSAPARSDFSGVTSPASTPAPSRLSPETSFQPVAETVY